MPAYPRNKEFDLLCQSIRMDDPDEARLAARSLLTAGGIDWSELWQRASWHRIRPQVGRLLADMPANLVPPDFQEKLAGVRRQNASRQLANAGLFILLHKALDPVAILPFKGFWLAHERYGSLEGRESEDLDLFIHPGDLDAIKAFLLEQGFQPMQGYPPWSEQRIMEEFGEYNLDKFHEGMRTYHVECHGTLGARIQRLGLRLSDLEDQVIRRTFSGHDIQVFSPTAHALLTILHHGGKDAWEELRQVHDMGMFMQDTGEPLDWDWIRSKARHFEAEPILDIGLTLASVLTGVAIPNVARLPVASSRIDRLTQGRLVLLAKSAKYWNSLRTYGHRWWFHVQTRDSLGSRVRWTWDYFRETAISAPGRSVDPDTGSWMSRWLAILRHGWLRILRILRMAMASRK